MDQYPSLIQRHTTSWTCGVRILLGLCALAVLLRLFTQAWAANGWYAETVPEDIQREPKYGAYRHQKDQAMMVYVPAGAFLRGTPTAQSQALAAQFGAHYAVETPQRLIVMSAFYIDTFEVTNQQYAHFLALPRQERQRYTHPTAPVDKDYTPTYWQDPRLNGPQHPVTGVDWYDAYAYCRWAGKSLPTEAQWEKAARGPHGREFPWGDTWTAAWSNNVESTLGQAVLDAEHWIRLLGPLRLDTMPVLTRPVGSFPLGVSPYGVHDMGGNLWEWCHDSYAPDYYRTSPAWNPLGPASSSYKVLRGGCWSSHRGQVRAAYRNYDLATDRHLEIGFRCVQAAP
jgi:formylglycine-generating enzyme required for sulfatase activity